jgi:hypothetical protein
MFGQNTDPLHFNMWRARGLLQDPGHPVETPTEAGTCGVAKMSALLSTCVARGAGLVAAETTGVWR